MDKLQKDINNAISELVGGLMKAVKDAESNKHPVDYTGFVSLQAEINNKINNAILECRGRQKSPDKKGWLS